MISKPGLLHAARLPHSRHCRKDHSDFHGQQKGLCPLAQIPMLVNAREVSRSPDQGLLQKLQLDTETALLLQHSKKQAEA